MTTDFDRHLHAFANTVQDPAKMTMDQRAGIARLLNVHVDALPVCFVGRVGLSTKGVSGPSSFSLA
jgi:hypothetical protein